MSNYSQRLFIGNEWREVEFAVVKTINAHSNRTYKVLIDTNTNKKYFGIYNQRVDDVVIDKQISIYNTSQRIPGIIDVYAIEPSYVITDFVDYYPMIITGTCNFYGKEKYIEHSRAHYQKFKMPITEKLLGEDNLKHLDIDPDYINNRQQLYDRIIKTYIDFHAETNCFFSDVDPNNILVNDDFTDFKIIDILSLKCDNDIDISGHQPFPVPIDRIIGPVPSHTYLHTI